MNKYVKSYFQRGLVFGGFGPIIAGIVFLILNFAIDDFGTGYSNLGYLKQMNVDEIKIDRVFVSGIEKETYNHKLISNVIEFAKSVLIKSLLISIYM